jgi:hypothetical protein
VLAAIFRCLQGRLGDIGRGDRRVDAADPFGGDEAELCKIGNPRVWAASTRLVAPRSCWARTACRVQHGLGSTSCASVALWAIFSDYRFR